MFGRKKSEKEEEKKLSGPKGIPGLVQNYLVAERKMDASVAKLGDFLNKCSKVRL